MVLGFKSGSREGMILSIFGIQAMYFSGLLDVNFAPIYPAFIQHLRVFTIELELVPNFLTKMMGQTTHTSDLLTYDSYNFYKIANIVEF